MVFPKLDPSLPSLLQQEIVWCAAIGGDDDIRRRSFLVASFGTLRMH